MNKVQTALYSFILAFCSLGYEFVFIKVATALQGGQITKYNLTISLFTFSLGVGALALDHLEQKFKNLSTHEFLFCVEFLLFTLGSLIPILSITTHSMILCHSGIIIIGLLSGLELPLLLKLAKDKDEKVMGWDYLGMFAASLTIPLIFIADFGLMATSLSLSLLNLLCSLYLLKKLHQHHFKWIPLLILPLILTVFSYHGELNQWLSSLYLGGLS